MRKGTILGFGIAVVLVLGIGGAAVQRPAVDAALMREPGAAGAAAEANMIQNPGLESAGNGLPQCWASSEFGDNAPAYSVVAPGHSGGHAAQIVMSKWTSGDAKILPVLDQGDCSPTGMPGAKYQLKAWYKATTPTQFELYVRPESGPWTYWTASPQFNAADQWTQVTWTTPALPAGAAGISFGLNIQADGTLVTDDYEMYEVPPEAEAPPETSAVPEMSAAPSPSGSGTPSVSPTSSGTPPPLSPGSRSVSFADIPRGYEFYDQINWMAAAGISRGYEEDNTYRSQLPVTREVMAAFLFRYAGNPAYQPPAVSPFKDVAADSRFYREIAWLSQAGISNGYPDATFHPTEAVNRDALAAFLYRMNGQPPVPGKAAFTDVAADSGFAPAITWLSQLGPTGWPDGSFRPKEPVHRDAAAVFLYRYNAKFGS